MSVTKKQGAATQRVGVTRDGVVTTGLLVLEGSGIAKLSTRAVAAELGVSMNTVLWHVGTKKRLLELMAESITGEVELDGLPEPWFDRAVELLRRLRHVLLGHRDGAAVVAGTFPAEPHTLAFADRLVSAVLAGGASSRQAAWITWSLFYFTLGLVQEEQGAPSTWSAPPPVVFDDLPGLQAVWSDLSRTDFVERFEFGTARILGKGPGTEDGPYSPADP